MATEEQTQQDSNLILGSTNTRMAQRLTISNRTVAKLALLIGVTLAPDGILYFKIWKVSDGSVVCSKAWGQAYDVPSGTPDTYPDDLLEVEFDTPVLINEEVYIGFQHDSSTATNYLYVRYKGSNVKASEYFCRYAGGWLSVASGARDMAYRYTYGTKATVTTQAVTDITGTTATGNGNITATSGESVTQHGVCWNTGGTPTTADSKTEEGAGSTGAFTSSITGLTKETKYYVRAYVTTAVGTSYGAEVEFTTYIASFPTDAIIRVTNLIHRYNRKEQVYTLELALGEVTSDFGLPEWLTKPQATTPEEGERRAKEEIKKIADTATEAVQEEVERIKRQAERFDEQIVKQQEEAEEEKRKADARLWRAQEELNKKAQEDLQAAIDRMMRAPERYEKTPKTTYPRTRKDLTTEQKKLFGGY